MSVPNKHVAVPQVVIQGTILLATYNFALFNMWLTHLQDGGKRRAACGSSFGPVMEVTQLIQLVFNSIEPKHVATPIEGEAGKELCIQVIKGICLMNTQLEFDTCFHCKFIFVILPH